MTKLRSKGLSTVLLVWSAIAIAGTLRAQDKAASAPAASKDVDGKAYSFEVVSIRENHGAMTMPQYGPTADGYRATNLPILLPILTAFVPQVGGSALYQRDQLIGVPDWMLTARFDIDAKVSEADLADWKKPALQEGMLRSMLQAMLTERLGLKVHRESKEVATYSLLVGKGGVKFKETDPAATHPGGMTLPGGAVAVPDFKDGQVKLTMYGTSMALFATFLTNSAGRPVQDKTGLSGSYDLQVPLPARVAPAGLGDAAGDSGPSVFSSVEALGLKLEATKGVVENLVFDHVERPSAN